jgi:hypothetical protein
MAETPQNPSASPETKEEETPASGFKNAAGTAKTISNTVSAGGAVVNTGVSVATHSAAQAASAATVAQAAQAADKASGIWFVGKDIAKGTLDAGKAGGKAITDAAAATGAKDFGGAVSTGLHDGVKGAFNVTWFGMAVGGVIAAAKVVPAAIGLIQGKKTATKAISEMVGGTTLAGLSMLGVSGLALIPDLATKVFTGKSITERVADGAEGATLHVMGEGKDKDKGKKPHIKEVNGVTVPATAAVVAGGVTAAGLAANQVTQANGKPLTLGTAPKQVGTPVALSGQPIVPNQVMPVQYSPQQALQQSTPAQLSPEVTQDMPAHGKGSHYWRDRVTAERQGQGIAQQQAAANTNTPIAVADDAGRPISKVEIENARRQLAAQNPDLALTGMV